MKPKEDKKRSEQPKNKEKEDKGESDSQNEEREDFTPDVSAHPKKQNNGKQKRKAIEAQVTEKRPKEKKRGSSKLKKAEKEMNKGIEKKGVKNKNSG